ncbi:hypothetical protein CJU90_5338 [Yarrowia sp. C11]|nr:hypothetical protein CJU90_5338 [Yarrowia sp. C11]KAG5363941.1 hypothetical protein CKK34_2717 [Yarrowia sp. E02]
MWSYLFGDKRPYKVYIKVELSYYIAPGDSTYRTITTEIELHKKPYWKSDVECLRELRHHIPQLDEHSVYVISNPSNRDLPYRRLEGSLWPRFSHELVQLVETPDSVTGSGAWSIREVSQEVRAQQSMVKMAEKLEKLDGLEKSVKQMTREMRAANAETRLEHRKVKQLTMGEDG